MPYKSVNVVSKPGGIETTRAPRPSAINAASTAMMKPSTLSTGTHPADIVKQEVGLTRINIVKDPQQMPIASRETRATPGQDFHHFLVSNTHPGSAAPGPPINANTMPAISRKVNSKEETKQSEVVLRGAALMSSPSRGIPTSFGATFVESIDRSNAPRPAHPTLPKVFPVLDQRDFNHVDGLLANRTANGKILGNAAHRYINPAHVPYNPPEEPVGPSNPYQKLNDTWTKCWDGEAGAVYYYNNQTGEATWILPDELAQR